MKPEKRPASKIPRVRKKKAALGMDYKPSMTNAELMAMRAQKKAKKAVPVMFGAPPILNGDMYVRDGATLELRAREMNYLQWLKNKYLLIGILIGMVLGYGLHSALTWL